MKMIENKMKTTKNLESITTDKTDEKSWNLIKTDENNGT